MWGRAGQGELGGAHKGRRSGVSCPLLESVLTCVHVYCKEKVPAPGRKMRADLVPAARVRLGARLPPAYAVSCWSQDVPVQLLEQGEEVSASRQMHQEHFGPPKAATASTRLGISSPDGAYTSLSVCLLVMCSASITVEPAKGKVGSCTPQPGQRPSEETQDTVCSLLLGYGCVLPWDMLPPLYTPLANISLNKITSILSSAVMIHLLFPSIPSPAFLSRPLLSLRFPSSLPSLTLPLSLCKSQGCLLHLQGAVPKRQPSAVCHKLPFFWEWGRGSINTRLIPTKGKAILPGQLRRAYTEGRKIYTQGWDAEIFNECREEKEVTPSRSPSVWESPRPT